MTTFVNASVVHVDGSQAMTAALVLAAAGITFPTSAITITDVLDEDAMGTDSATVLATQQSIKAYADLMLPLAGGALTGELAMGANKITGVLDPIADQDAATKIYADLMLPLAGGTMSGPIAMGTSKITGLGDGTTATQDAVTVVQLEAKRISLDIAGEDGIGNDVTVHEGSVRLYNRSGKARTVLQIHTSVSVAPTGAALVSSVDLGGSTMYTTGPETNAPSIAISAFVSSGGVPEVTAWADGAYLEFNVDQIGSTAVCQNLIYTVVYTEVI